MNITPGWNGFLKGLLLSVIAVVVVYFEDAAHLSGIIPTALIPLVVAIASALESSIKASTGNGLFGAVRVSKV